MPSRVTRSGREVKHSSTQQSKLDALELLARQRRGEKVDVGIKEDAPLFEEVDEEDYKRTRKGNFIIDADSDDAESDLDFIDDDGYDEDDAQGTSNRRSRFSRKDGKSSSRSRKELETDPTQRSMRSFLGGSKSKPSSSASTSKQVDPDDILNNMLLDVPKNSVSNIQKPLKVSVRPSPSEASESRPFKSLKTKSTFESGNVKRARVSSPPPTIDDFIPDMPDDWTNDGYDQPAPTAIDPKSSQTIHLDEQSLDDMDDCGIKASPLDHDLKSNLEFHDIDGVKNFTRFYWYDSCEDQYKNPGVVYFFGRIFAKTTKQYVSCTVLVKNVMKTYYLHIKEDSTYEQAVSEFTHIHAKNLRIRNFTCEKVTKKYAFSATTNIPLVADYVKIDVPSSQAKIPNNLTGETFSTILNINQTAMEKLILDLKLRGPCWLKLVSPDAPDNPLTWSRIELVLENPQQIIVDDSSPLPVAPYFCAFSLSLLTYSNPTTHHNEVIAIAGMVNTAFNLDQCLKRNNKASGHFCIMTKPAAGHKELKLPFDFHIAAKGYKKTRFELFESERDLLNAFIEKFSDFDPDIVIGHDLLNFDYETLICRMRSFKLGTWSKLGRFKRSELPATKAAFRQLFSGRILSDIKVSAMELIQSRSYDLTELTSRVLNKKRVELNQDAVVEAFQKSTTLINLIHSTWEDNDNIFSILVELNVIPLALKITNITGNILSRTLSAGRSERNEYLLLHAFHEQNFICPEKLILSNRQGDRCKDQGDLAPTRKKAAYTGGLVLEPKSGYYENCILLMDFNSLYPSIIQEFNICFSTVTLPPISDSESRTELIPSLPDSEAATGVLPAQLRNLVEGRLRVKRQLAEAKFEEQKLMLDIEQKALKLTANSMYGCLGFEYSRFYAKHLASLVTFKGREILMNTKTMVEKLGYEVIYGDTDSLMINTKIPQYDEVIQCGTSIKEAINKTFKLLEIDIDGVYRPLLLLKKKNYAGATIKKSQNGEIIKSIETKGLDTVRRDRAVIAKRVGDRVLDMLLLSEKEIDQKVEDIHNYLKELSVNIRENQVKREDFLISKQLNRNPEEYRDTKGLGHIALALRYNSDPKKPKKLKCGDTVEYVVCLDGTTESANQRAYSLEEMAEKNLSLDIEYYLCQQVHSSMTRICDKLPVTNAYILAEMLGIEKSSMLQIKRPDSELVKRDQLISRGESRFNSCSPLVIICPNCNLPDEIKSRARKNKDKKLELSVGHCPQCNFRYAMRYQSIVSQVISEMRRLTIELHTSKFFCENMECDHQTRNVFCRLSNADSSSSSSKVQPLCDLCDSPMYPEMDDRKMDLQLSFYKHLFSLSGSINESGGRLELTHLPEDQVTMYESCTREIEHALRDSVINNIDAYVMFSMICSGSAI